MNAQARFLAPADVANELESVEVNQNGEAGSYHPQVSTANLALLWRRYMPAHDIGSELYSPGGADFGGLQCRENRKKQAAQTWKGYGALKWFCDTAELIAKQETWELATDLRKRREQIYSGSSCRWLTLTALRRWVVGAGNPATFENSGLTFHETYGFPIVPAASIKGIARHYLEMEYGMDELSSEKRPDSLFGSTEDGMGLVDIDDAWPVNGEKGWFDVDVLTPHHSEYYKGDREEASDTEDPILSHFLTIRQGVSFHMPLTLTARGRKQLKNAQQRVLDFAAKLIKESIETNGIGAHTGSGYGLAKVK